ncbi:MAG: calcium-binding protein [Brevirhabdus sp.]
MPNETEQNPDQTTADATEQSSPVETIIGTQGNDTLTGSEGVVSSINGNSGSDTLSAGDGSDLVAGDMVGAEWAFVDGRWVYDPAAMSNGTPVSRDYNDTIDAGAGDDVLLGNGGHDLLRAGSGDDLVNAGTGRDRALGGEGNDILNLEAGSDTGSGGLGDDTVNAGTGDDLVYGDQGAQNLLARLDGEHPASFDQFAASGLWTVDGTPGAQSMTQTVETTPDETYSLSFELAANLGAGTTSGAVEVVWNGDVIATVETSSGAFETHSIEVPAGADAAELTFREVSSDTPGLDINTDGPAFHYAKTMTIQGQEAEVAAFAPGQAKLYQVIDGQLMVFDTATDSYAAAGDPTGFKINAVGFNVEDDLLYGIAKSDGVDALGNTISRSDLVMLDAEGNAYRVGDTPVLDYVGDFDGDGNLWTFHSSLNRVTMIDVDNLDENGDPVSIDYNLPNDFFEGRAYDIAYNAEEGVFYAVESPGKNGEPGQVHRIDLSDVPNGGEPRIESVEISATLFDDQMVEGMAKGAYGAVFFDGDGNLYFGLNRGDHDLDGSTEATGGIYKVNVDWGEGTAYAEFMAEAQATGSNDGAVDPRAPDAFNAPQTDATILIRDVSLVGQSGGNDDLRGGDGQDTLFGEAGDDELYGGDGDDQMSGGIGNDKLVGGEGADVMDGDTGNDKLIGGVGDDTVAGGSGDDVVIGGTGNDVMDGDTGNDKLLGGTGNDVMDGGTGSDKLQGGTGNDVMDGDTGADKLLGGAGNDTASGGSGDDYVNGGKGDDRLDGGSGSDKLVGGTGSDTISGGAGDDHMWGGAWKGDNAADTFVVGADGGKDMIHDFEIDHDMIDLSAYGVSFEDVQGLMSDKGWATEIDLSGLDGGQPGDKLIIKAVDPDDLDESNFIL